MTDIRLNISWYTSLKRKALIRRIGHDGVTAIIDLWLYTAQHRPDGNLSGLSDEDITEAAQFSGDPDTFLKAIGPKPEGLGFLDGDSGSRKLHDWKEHNPWAANAKARSRAAKKAVEVRWRKEREMRDEYDANTERMRKVIPLSSPLPSAPSPTPKSKTPAAKPSGKSKGNSEPKGNPVKIWVDLMKEIRDDIYKPNGPAIGNINNAFKHLNGDTAEFEKRVRLYLSSEYVKLPTPTKFYNAIENYKVGSEDEFFDEDVDF